jgi:DNA ligase-1
MQTLSKFHELYKKLTATASRLEKEAILSQYRQDEDIRAVLHFLFNPFIVTGISGKKPAKNVTETSASREAPETLLSLLDYFREHGTGRDEDILVLKKFASGAENELRDFVFNIIKKDLTMGASEITLNKVFGAGFIPSFNVMLAEKYGENMDFAEGKRFIITEKLDGIRCMLIFNDAGTPAFFSRAGKSIDDLIELSAEAEKLDKSLVYDGELLLNTSNGHGEMDSADLYRATVKVTSRDGEKRNLIYNVFDCLPKADLLSGKCCTECETRKTELKKQLIKLNLPHIRPVPMLYVGEEIGKIDELCDKYTDMGKEGIMVNIADAPYECKRTKNLLKVKRFNAADVYVLDWEEGTGANKGKLGAVIVEFIAPDGKKYKCRVGSGFEKEEREQFFVSPEKIVGHIIEIGYFELSKNQNDDGYSLRFPTFKCLRYDKNEISMH